MKQDNSNIEELLQDDEFVRWVLYNKGSEKWLPLYRAQPQLVAQARDFILKVKEAEEIPDSDEQEDKVWERIVYSRMQKDRKSRQWLQWAAGVVLASALGWSAYEYRPEAPREPVWQEVVTSQEAQLITRENTSEGVQDIVLEDGSLVRLERGSKITYRQPFDAEERRVFFSGEAFFRISRDVDRPFVVESKDVVTRVLGTSFTVKESGGKTEVNVLTGRVSVSRQKDPVVKQEQVVVLDPNQKVVFTHRTEEFQKQLSENPVPQTRLEEYPKLRFEEISVPELLDLLEDRYKVRFVYDRKMLRKCIITTTLNDNPLFDNLEVICRTIGATYREVDAQIVIESGGCFSYNP